MKTIDGLSDQDVRDIQLTYSRPRTSIRTWNGRWLHLFTSGHLVGDGEFALYLPADPTPEQLRHLKKLLDLLIVPENFERPARAGADGQEAPVGLPASAPASSLASQGEDRG